MGSQPAAGPGSAARRRDGPAVLSRVDHILVLTLENRSFDQLFGHFPGASGIPPGVCLPNPAGGCTAPFHEKSLAVGTLTRPLHSWADIHEEWDGGRMDGFVRANGSLAMGYYLGYDIPSLFDLARKFTLCDRYFCSVLGPTFPNRLYAVSGTSSGLENDPPQWGSDTFSQPTVFDQLQEAGVSWRYYGGLYTRVLPLAAKMALMSPLLWFPRITKNPAMMANLASQARFFADARAGRLPEVAFLSPGALTAGEPPVSLGCMLRFLTKVMAAVQSSRDWARTVMVINFDEAGGFYDHMAPPVVDAYGPGLRVPCIVASPLIEGGRVNHTVMDHTSVLRLIQERHHLPPLTDRNRLMASMSEVLA